VIARPALWPPATTPIEAASSRRRLRPRRYTYALAFTATLSCVLWLVTRSSPQLAIGVAIWVTIVVDAAVAHRAMRDVEIELLANPLLVTTDPFACTVRVTGGRRPVVLMPATRPSVQRFLVEGPEPGLLVLAPRRRGVVHTLVVDATTVGPIALVECGRRFRVRLSTSVTIGPAPVPHEVDWPTPRAVGFGLTESAPVGDDLYRSIRPYRRGDSRRRVHWKASAHHGSLMVKESDGTGVASLRIIVQLDGPGVGAELALERAAFVAVSALRRSWNTELVTVQPRTVPSSPAPRLGSPFGAVPIELTPLLGSTHVVAHALHDERSVVSTLATACYGPVAARKHAGLTYLVSTSGDRWQ
jgi:uncharacterized protein (DUF58 family)